MHGLTDEISALVLQQAFGLALEDLENPSDAWLATHTCLRDLSRICSRQDQSNGLHQKLVQGGNSSFGSRYHSGHADQGGQGPQSLSNNSSSESNNNGCGTNATEQRGHGTKRTRGDGAGGSDESDPPATKHPRVGSIEPSGPLYSCPFRKRNGARFNIRDHESCARQGHTTFSLLK